MNGKLMYRTKKEIYAETINGIRRTYSEYTDFDQREQKIYGSIFMGFENLVKLHGADDNREVREHLFNIYFKEVFGKMPELNHLVKEVAVMAWQQCVRGVGVTYFYSLCL